MREGAVSAKRGWVSFGAKPAQSETLVRAAAKRRPPGRGRSGTMGRSSDYEGGEVEKLDFRESAAFLTDGRSADLSEQPV